ncbi:MAG: hypothetical protein KDD32_10160 [Bacteroidetes bacterium]|nr:hypothetical protein [Bacteroidota bacterium]
MKRTFYTSIATVLCVILVFATSGCSQLYDLINDSGDALKQDLFEVSDSLENNIESLSENLLQFLESDRMNVLVDSVITQASASFVKGLNIDSLLGTIDANLDATLAGVLDSLLSQSVSDEIGESLRNVLEKSGLDPESLKSLLLNEETTAFLVNLKNEILGNTTPALVDSIMEAAMLVFEKYYDKTIEPDIDKLSNNLTAINDNLQGESSTWSNLLRNGIIGLLSAFLVALMAILGFRIYKTHQYRNLVRVMATKIDKMKDQDAYDALTKEIAFETQHKDLNVLLDKSIKDIKEKSAKEWKDKDNQVLKLLSKYAKQGESMSFSSANLQDMKAEAESRGLLDHLESTLARYGES